MNKSLTRVKIPRLMRSDENNSGLPFSVGAQTEAGQAVGLSWASEAGRLYQVWTTDDLTSTNWVMLGTPVEGTGSTVTLTNIPTSGDAVRFFQVRRL